MKRLSLPISQEDGSDTRAPASNVLETEKDTRRTEPPRTSRCYANGRLSASTTWPSPCAQVYQVAERSLRARWGRAADRHPTLGKIFNNLAVISSRQVRYAEAEAYHLRALGVRQAAYGESHSEVAHSVHNLAEVIHHQGRHTEADSIHTQAVSTYEASTGLNSPWALYVQVDYFDTMLAAGRFEAAAMASRTSCRAGVARSRPESSERREEIRIADQALYGLEIQLFPERRSTAASMA